MQAHSSPIKFTYEDYLLFPDDGRRHELIDGDHYVTPSPVTKHQRIVVRLSGLLFRYLTDAKVGEVFVAPMDVVFSDLDVVQPDLLFVAVGRTIITETNVQGAPDLCVEILSDGSRKTDEIVKRKLYERYGVSEYWIIDPELETVKIYRLIDGRYGRAVELSRETSDTLSSALLPNLTIPLAALFE